MTAGALLPSSDHEQRGAAEQRRDEQQRAAGRTSPRDA